MPDLVQSLLSRLPATNKQRAELWDAFNDSKDEDELTAKIQDMSVPKHVKAQLWDLKVSAQSNPPPPEPMPSTTPEQIQNNPNPLGVNPGPGLDVLKRFAGGVAESLDPRTLIPGALNMMAHPITNIVDPMAQNAVAAQDLAKEGRYSEALGHAGASILPVVGPAAAEIGQDIGETGDVARGVGRASGMILGGKVLEGAPRVIKPLAKVGGRMIEKAAPVVKDFTIRHAPGIGASIGAGVGGMVGGPLGSVTGTVLGREAGQILKTGERAKSIEAAKTSRTASEAEAAAAKETAKKASEQKAKERAEDSESVETERQKQAVEDKVTKRELSDAAKLAKMDKATEARLAHVVKQAAKEAETPKAGTYAEESAARAERQKGHIAESQAKTAAKNEANIAEEGNLEQRLKDSLENLKAKKGQPSAVQAAQDLATKIQGMHEHGLSAGQMKDVLRTDFGIESKHATQAINMVLKSLKESK